MAERRAAGEPLQYVTGVAGFRRLDIFVGPGVFIPRPETELVAEKAMELLPRSGTVVDVGTGSGAIALAIKDERPDANVIATEVSDEAVLWARRNVESTGLAIDLMPGDLLSPVPERLRGRVEVIVSNPPYIPPEDAHLLPVDVAQHEPKVALFADAGGLEMLARIAAEAQEWLGPGRWLVMEIGDRQEKSATALLADAGYTDIRVEMDLADRPRIASARKQ
jgi:release factor glutamine methyltransferase